MSWFGETFGDSLSSLKGQITKITKEVLAEDVPTGSDNQESEISLVKELEALCESKDLEIAALRDEINKLRKSESPKGPEQTEPSNAICDNDRLCIKQLENDLVEVKQERDHLNSCLEELQAEHQINLDKVISLRDKYKSELEELKRAHEDLKIKYSEALNNENKGEEIDRDVELNLLNAQISELHLQFDREKQELCDAVSEEVQKQNGLKEDLSRLLAEVEELNKVKQKAEDERKITQTENEELRNRLALRENEKTETEIKLKLLSNEREELLKKCRSLELLESKLSDSEADKAKVQENVENLLQVLNINTGTERDTCRMIEMIGTRFHEKCNEMSKSWKDLISSLEVELKNLKEENKNIQEKLKMSTEKEANMERKHQEEISLLKNQEHDCMHQSQTDDVKRLEQEIKQCMALILVKDKEITNYSRSLHQLEEELKDLKGSSLRTEEELEATKKEKLELQAEIERIKEFSEKINEEKLELEDRQRLLEVERANLNQMNSQLINQSGELEKQVSELTIGSEKLRGMEEEVRRVIHSKSVLEKRVEELQNENLKLKNELEYLKAQWIVADTSLAELKKANVHFQNEVGELQTALHNSENEKDKWKDVSVSLQIQLEDLTEKKEEVANEFTKLKTELEGLPAKNAEIEQLKATNLNLMKSCNELQQQLENKSREDQSRSAKDPEEKCKSHLEAASAQLQEENNELKRRLQELEQELKTRTFQSNNSVAAKENIQQHRRSRSAADTESQTLLGGHQSEPSSCPNDEQLAVLKRALKQEESKYQALQHQFQEILAKETTARKEFERLKQHLIEVEDHYTEETVEKEKIISELNSKLVAAEEQLQNSSTLYTSLKVRDNQHLESLQSQIRMVTAQRDDLQTKVSAAEDEVQKHKASLMSLQIVLEQFQQDKEREIKQTAMKYEKQLLQADARFRNLEQELEGLKKQLAEAKNGLKAASRLGEQLEKKTRQVSQLEEDLSNLKGRVAELEESLAGAQQANSGKVDLSLIKNLLIGYILSPNAERKCQVLRIMASVLDFSEEERRKMGVDGGQSGWLSSILHPKGEGRPGNESLSEAFIKFLESESRPQPQLRLLPEGVQGGGSRTSRAPPKASNRLSELTLPTFNSSQDNDSSIILKNVLKDS